MSRAKILILAFLLCVSSASSQYTLSFKGAQLDSALRSLINGYGTAGGTYHFLRWYLSGVQKGWISDSGNAHFQKLFSADTSFFAFIKFPDGTVMSTGSVGGASAQMISDSITARGILDTTAIGHLAVKTGTASLGSAGVWTGTKNDTPATLAAMRTWVMGYVSGGGGAPPSAPTLAFDAAASIDAGGVGELNEVSVPITFGSNADFALVIISTNSQYSANDIDTVQVVGGARGTKYASDANSSVGGGIHVWGIKGPGTGLKSVRVHTPNVRSMSLCVLSFQGVDTNNVTYGSLATGTSATGSATVTSTSASDIVVGAFVNAGATITASGGAVQRASIIETGSYHRSSGQTQSGTNGTATVSANCGGDAWFAFGVNLKQE